MERIFPSGKMSRAGIARNFTDQFDVTLLLKGSRTIVAQKNLPLSYNQTGNPGMATGGMGDVLTGVCAGLIGQGLSLYDAARIGVWLCGRAAEICVFEKDSSEESLLPRDVLDNLGAVLNLLRSSMDAPMLILSAFCRSDSASCQPRSSVSNSLSVSRCGRAVHCIGGLDWGRGRRIESDRHFTGDRDSAGRNVDRGIHARCREAS